MILLIDFFLIILLAYTAVSVIYHLILALVFFIVREPQNGTPQRKNKFALVVPAHNEEMLISKTCDNLLSIDYPADLRNIYVIADNCTDKTADICRSKVIDVMCRSDKEKAGKGYALKWAFDSIKLKDFDAVLILDADTTVDPAILHELNDMLETGSQVIQCYIKVPNREESWFTQLIHVSRTINNLLYHDAKYKIGLSSYLMGSGMCFKSSLLQEQPWTAFTLSEDWEYFAKLIENGRKVDFGVRAVVLQQESRSLKQATTQRLRWSKGRFHVVKNIGVHLFLKGLRTRNWRMADASLALLFPNWSLQINLIIMALFLSMALPVSPLHTWALFASLGMLASQGLILLAGVYLAGDHYRVIKAILVAPIFLAWKFIIDFVSFTGLYRGKEWIRTDRHIPDEIKRD